jgi:NADH-quinone oxidoreductase subunit L
MKIVEQIKLFCFLIAGLPLLGFLINGLGYRRIPKILAGAISSLMVVIPFLVTLPLLYFYQDMGGQELPVSFFDWLPAGNIQIAFSFFIDQLTLLMLLIVTGVGSLIHLYSVGYMKHDEGYGKFFAFLNLFVFFMLILVMGGNYVMMFIGWEGVGLCSYLLIGFWNTNPQYGYAARKAFIMNRIGDLGFLLGIFLLFYVFGSSDFEIIFNQAISMKAGDKLIGLITLLLFVGAMGKSAQIPLYTWLPDAMAGPTPVSALIHAATMVTAGIYMVVRSHILYILAPDTLQLIAYVGLATALFAATIGLFQHDIKKVLAYSTVSQLGYMFLALGAGAFTSAMFHVMTHAFFKALLFLGAGSVIHAMSDEQDIRMMGGLRKKLPITFATFLVGTIAIAGIPPFAGFFSKDEILAHVYEYSPILWGIGVFTAALTSFYMFRVLFVTFSGSFRGTHEQEHHLHESPLTMTIPLLLLAAFSVVGGLVGPPPVLSQNHRLEKFLAPVFTAAKKINPELFKEHALNNQTEWMLIGVSVGVALLSMAAAFVVFVVRKSVPQSETEMQGVYKFLYHEYYVDELYDLLFVRPIAALSGFFGQVTEALIDLLVNGTGRMVQWAASLLRLVQGGRIGYYIFAMVFGIGLILLLNFVL